MVRKIDGGRIFYIVNLSENSVCGVTASLADCGKICGLDMDTLEPFALHGEQRDSGALVTLDFAPGQSYVLVESPDAPDFLREPPVRPAPIKLGGRLAFVPRAPRTR